MAGLMSLMQDQPMPGQAPQQPMPGMMPQQGAPTPGAMTGSLKNLPLDQLKMMYLNPQENSPPLWAVISALAEKQKEAQAMMAAQGQSAMAQNAQMQQQPPVAAQVVQAAEQMAPQGYAGGGAVAFKYAGYVPPREEGESFEDYRQRVMRFQDQKLAEEKAEARRKTEEYYAGELAARKGLARPSPFTGQARPVDTSKLFPFGSPESPMMDVPEIQVAPSPAPAGQRRQPAAQKPPATGIASALQEQPPTPAIDAYAAASAAQQEAIRRAGQVTPEEIAARGGIDKLLGEAVSGFEAERKRRDALAQQRLEEARAQKETPFLRDPVALGEAIAGMRGAKTFYEGITGLASAGGTAERRRREAFQAAQEKFDLSGKEMFELSRLQQQVQMDQAKLAEARASGDAQRSVKAALDVANSQKELAQYQTELGMKREKLTLEGRQVAADERRARAAEISAGKPTAQEFAYALFKSNPEKYKEFLAAGQEPKSEGAMLKEIVVAAMKNPLMLQQYPPAIQALVNQELLKLGVTSALPKGAPVRE